MYGSGDPSKTRSQNWANHLGELHELADLLGQYDGVPADYTYNRVIQMFKSCAESDSIIHMND